MSSRRRPGDWMCPNCDFLIFASKSSCKKCGATKPRRGKLGKSGKSDGDDWVCNACKTSNFYDREKCRKCDKYKTESGDNENDEEKKEENVSIKLNVEIELKLKELKQANGVDIDLLFIMDCTGSMARYINAGKQTIKNIINELKNDRNNNINNINFGYIAYRDQPKSWRTQQYFVTKCFPFTDDVNKMYEYIKTYDAAANTDGPEALTEALHDSLTKIKYNDNNIKINILICDAPGHGWQCTSYDNYPKGNPNGYDPIKLCHEMAARGIILYILGCEPSISYYKNAKDILEGMSKITEGFYLPLTNADLLPDIISKSVKQEINLKYIEKFIINMMINIRSEKNNEDISDEGQLLDNLDMDLIKKLKMENKIEIGNVYNGDYDYFNINLIKKTEDDEKKQNIQYILENMKKDLKQPSIKKFYAKSKFDMKSGDWECRKCHYHNFANRWFCKMCNNINHTLKNGDWLCTKCDDINFGKNKVCRKCKVTKKPNNGPNIIQKKKDNKDNEEKESKQEIKDINCSINNDIFGIVINRIKKQHKFHDWKCKSCKYINFERNEKCKKCDITKSDNFGDWKCNGCYFMNFGIRKNCKRCNQIKST